LSQTLIEFLKDKNILLVGFGREGRSTLNYIRRYMPDARLTIADKNPVETDDPNIRLITGAGYLDGVNGFDLIIKSPGVSFRGVGLDPGVTVTCQTDLFLRFAPCVKAGVTGTKGKTTTSTLIYGILQAAEMPSCLIGNMGLPVLDAMDGCEGQVAVIELSSHQLEFTRCSPHVAVFTNLYEEHLDHYDGFRGYANAKWNIAAHQSERDFFIYNRDQDLSGIYDFGGALAQKIPVSTMDGEKSDFLRTLAGANPKLIGEHNRYDVFYAAAAAKCLGVTEDKILQGVKNFGGIEHRMEFAGTFSGIKFYNDCIATIPKAVICAVEALNDVDTLIFGGMDRGLDYADFCESLENSSVRNLIGLPETGHAICSGLETGGSAKNLIKAKDMRDAVNAAFELTEKGKSCLLSPAAASYNDYRDFDEKGNHYKQLVRNWETTR